jgi:hypothetical protein
MEESTKYFRNIVEGIIKKLTASNSREVRYFSGANYSPQLQFCNEKIEGATAITIKSYLKLDNRFRQITNNTFELIET